MTINTNKDAFIKAIDKLDEMSFREYKNQLIIYNPNALNGLKWSSRVDLGYMGGQTVTADTLQGIRSAISNILENGDK